MQTFSLSSSALCYSKHMFSVKTPQSHQSRASCHLVSEREKLQRPLSSISYNPLRLSVDDKVRVGKMKRRGLGAVCYSGPLTSRNLQWLSAVSTAILMISKGTAIQKSFLAPFFALQAPASIVSWIKGEYGMWTAFLALLIRLFFHIPGELELPFITFLLVIVAPPEIMRLRGTQEGVILSLIIAAYLAFQHFTRAGSLRKSFDQGSIIATLTTICIAVVPCLLLI